VTILAQPDICDCDVTERTTSNDLPSWCSNCGEQLSEEQMTEYYDLAQQVSIDLIKEQRIVTDDKEDEVELAEVEE
tara:strand:+ start:1502 stop:1729 length:228 start_codon:yes stop_codon:yes gene_type:complete